MVDTVIVEAESSPVSAVSWPAIIAGIFMTATAVMVSARNGRS